MNQAIARLSARLKQEKLDCLIVSSPANLTYLTGYPNPEACLIVSKNRKIYLTDSRFTEEARMFLPSGFLLKKIDKSFVRTIAVICLRHKLKRIGFEEKAISYTTFVKLKKELARQGRLIPCPGIIEEFRMIKTKTELKKINKAIEIAHCGLKFAREFIRIGQKEIEVVAELERFLRYKGATNTAFDIIVAFGPNASFPHHRPGLRMLKRNEPVLIDLGVEYMGYKSDLTRVFFLGKISALERRIYNIVRSAQERAIRRIRPGIPIREIDAAARQYISKKGYGGFFAHSLGHGVGLEVHEAPRISTQEQGKLKKGMVFTVEPAIYLPNKFGIRIEDIVLVTGKGAKILSCRFQ